MNLKVDLIKNKIKKSILSQDIDIDLISINQRLERLRNESIYEKNILKYLGILLVCVFIVGYLNIPRKAQHLKVEGKIISPVYEMEKPKTQKKKFKKRLKSVPKQIFSSPYSNTVVIYQSPYKKTPPENKKKSKQSNLGSHKSFSKLVWKINPFKRQKLKLNIVEMLEDSYPITSGYGVRKDPIRFRGKKLKIKIYRYHYGIDIGAPNRTPIHSPEDAIVSEIHQSTCSGGGRKIYLDHYNGYQTVYMHLSKIIIQEGQYIKKGQLIGYTGMSGFRVTGPHLHLEVKRDGNHLNPYCFLEN